MQKKSRSESGIFTPRGIIACAFLATALLLCTFSFATFAGTPNNTRTTSKPARSVRPGDGVTPDAPTPSGGTLSTNSGPLAFTDSTPLVPNPTGEGVGFSKPTCTAPNTCSSYTLTLDPSIFAAAPGYNPTTTNIVIQISWATSALQYGTFVEDKNGNVIASNTAGLDPETITIPVVTSGLAAGSPYTIVTTAEIGGGQGISGTITLVSISGAGSVCNNCTPPRYQVYESPSGVALKSGEPSIGVDWNPNVASLKQIAPGNAAHGPTSMNTGGVTIFTSTFEQLRVDFDDCSSPAINTWLNTAFPTETLATSDVIGFTDHFTTAALGTSYPPPITPGRTFHGQLAGGDSVTAYTDDDGATHIQSQGGGVPQGPDHETIGGGPYNPNSVPPPPPHPTYPNAIYYCTQNIAPEAECSRSDDGGLTFGPSIPVYNLQQCSGSIHGHIKVAADGTVYLPNYSCTLPTGNQGVAVSSDNGITWTERNVPGSGSPKPGLVDPSVAVGLNDVGKISGQTTNTIYLGYIDNDGTPKIAASRDRGQTWSTPQNVGAAFGIVNSTFPVVVAGDDNRAAFGFLGTTTPGDSSLNFSFTGVWHAYIATTYDGGNSWVTIDATPNDPVQVGAICDGGTVACTQKRNLLDFNGFDVDAQGRGVFGLSDGCVNCTNSSTSGDSNAAQGLIIRQSGGPRLFSHFDPVEPAIPASPQAVSAVKGPSGVLVSWLEPDNGGSPITGYNIYRGTTSGGETLLAQVVNDPLNSHTKYLDTTALPSAPAYFYHVTAVNSHGESGFCQELTIGGGGCNVGLGTPCASPFVTVDCLGAAGSVPTDPTLGELTIQNVSIGEPFTSCTDNALTLVMRVQSLDPNNTGSTVLSPNSEWQILFNVTDTNNNPQTVFVDVSTIPPNSPATPAVALGRRDPTATGTIDNSICTQSATSTCALVSATTSKDGTITFKLNVANVIHFPAAGAPATNALAFDWDARNAGAKLSSIGGNTYLLVGAGAGFLETIQTTGATGSYTRSGNVSCSNKPPLAVLAATPLLGNAPLQVSFDASGSSEPNGSCGTINSYTLDFGDGTPPVTQGSPNFMHTYNNPGAYPARLVAKDTAGQTSTNLAQQVITVTSVSAPQLSSVDSVMTHGAAGAFSVNLLLTGTRGVECRSSAAMGAGNYTLVYTFAHNLVSVDSATVISGAATISSSAIGPNANQYTVNLSGVANAQYVTIGLVNAHDSTGVIGNVFGTMGLLIGDVNGVSGVTGSDVNLCKAQVGLDLSQSNFRNDINATGAVSGSDVNLTKAQVGMVLPP